MTLRTLLIVAGLGLAGGGGYWLGTQHTDGRIADGAAALLPALITSEDARLASLPSSAADSDARFVALTSEPIDDPQRALKKALRLTDDKVRRQQLARIGWAWGKASPEEAWKQAAKISDTASRWQLQSAIVTTWASEQPAQAFAYVAALPRDWQRDQLMRQVTAELARQDPRLALELLANAKVSDRRAFQTIVADEWSRFDPAGAAQWVETLDRLTQLQLAYTIADAYIAHQPDEALAWALRISRLRGRLWSHMVGLLAQQNPQEALRLAQSAGNRAQRGRAMGAVLRNIAAEDPALAISYLKDLPAGPERMQTTTQIALEMAKTSPEAALDWLADQPDAGARYQAMTNIVSTLAWEDVDAAAQLGDRVPQEFRGSWINYVASAYAYEDVDKGIEWVKQFENEPGYEGIIGDFATGLAMTDPEAAFELVERTADGTQRDRMLTNMITSGMADQSPEIASRWITKMSDDNARAQAVEHLAGAWGQYDLQAARKWVLSQPTGAARDRGLTQLASANASTADAALALIGEIQSQDQRMEAVMRTAERLSYVDPEQARILLRRQPLDPQRQRELDMRLQQQRQTHRRW